LRPRTRFVYGSWPPPSNSVVAAQRGRLPIYAGGHCRTCRHPIDNMICRVKLALVLCLFLAVGVDCRRFRVSDPGLKIGVTKTGGEYFFSFRTCRGQRVEIPWINVSRRVSCAKNGSTQCEVAVTDASITGISDHWRYGEVPPGYVVKKCEPLQAGYTYEIQAAGAAGGDRTFTLKQDGDLIVGPDSCK